MLIMDQDKERVSQNLDLLGFIVNLKISVRVPSQNIYNIRKRLTLLLCPLLHIMHCYYYGSHGCLDSFGPSNVIKDVDVYNIF